MDLPPPSVFTTYADVAFYPNATLPDYPQRRRGTAYVPVPSPAEIEQARNVYPKDPTEALRHEAAVVNWSARPGSQNYCLATRLATRDAPPIMTVFDNDRPKEALRYNLCISSPRDVPAVISRTAEQVVLTTAWAATTPLAVAVDILDLPLQFLDRIRGSR
jgi:hypothetical protein